MKPGYKQTEIGIIPEDWEVKNLGDMGTFKKGRNIPKRQLTDYGQPCILYGEIYTKYDYWAEELQSRISTQVAKQSTPIQYGDILFAGSGETAEEIGKCIAYMGSETAFAGGDLIVFTPNEDESLFLGYQLNSPLIAKQKTILGQGSSVVHIYVSSLTSVKVPVPSPLEQRIIAEALRDADDLLASLDGLIAKKRAVKLATMQQLLTGEKRLAGWNGRWETATIEDVADCLDHLRVPLNESQRNKMRGNIPYCGANGIIDYVNDYVVDDDIILIAEDGGYFDEYATRPIAYRMIGKCWVNNHAHILKAKEGFSQGFLFYSLVHKDIRKHLASGTRAKLNKSEMYKIEIFLPPNKEEQRAIAIILSDMDAEISALQARRDKTAAIKQGMMQQLLTGETRLV